MKGLRFQVVLVALVVLAAGAQCIVACATEACGGPVPVCHKHHAPKQAGCTHPLLEAVTRPQIMMAKAAPVAIGSAILAHVPAAPERDWPLEPAVAASPPYDPLLQFRTILRV